MAVDVEDSQMNQGGFFQDIGGLTSLSFRFWDEGKCVWKLYVMEVYVVK